MTAPCSHRLKTDQICHRLKTDQIAQEARDISVDRTLYLASIASLNLKEKVGRVGSHGQRIPLSLHYDFTWRRTTDQKVLHCSGAV